MDNERRVKILERSFEIMEEMLLKCFASNEEELRHNLKIEGERRLQEQKEKNLPVDEYIAIHEALTKLSGLSYEEIEEIYELIQ